MLVRVGGLPRARHLFCEIASFGASRTVTRGVAENTYVIAYTVEMSHLLLHGSVPVLERQTSRNATDTQAKGSLPLQQYHYQ